MTGFDHFENVAVGVFEEKTLERSLSFRIDQFGPSAAEPALERIKISQWNSDGDMASKLTFEWGGLEIVHAQQVELLIRADGKPGGVAYDIPRARDGSPSEGMLEEALGLGHVPGGEGDVSERGFQRATSAVTVNWTAALSGMSLMPTARRA